MIHLKRDRLTNKYEFPPDATANVSIEVCSKCLALALTDHNRLEDEAKFMTDSYNTAAKVLSDGVEFAQALEDLIADKKKPRTDAIRAAKELTASLMPPEGFNKKIETEDLLGFVRTIFGV